MPGIRLSRKLWTSFFDKCHCIIFLASLSCYNQTLHEDATVNRLTDSVDLFKTICDHKLLEKIDIILFLNKQDIFKQNIETIPFSSYFPEYIGANDEKSISAYIERMFRKAVTGTRKVEVYATSCTDTSVMNLIIANVMLSLLSTGMKGLGS